MATAAELLAAKASGTSTVDKTLVIDNYLRAIQIPSSITNLGVENDDDVLRLNFRMPRYLGKTDLSTFSVRINYLNAKGESDVYTVSDLTIVGDNLTFSWLVGPTATKYKGVTKFNVCMRIVDADAYVQKEYNTTIATLPVLEGLECEESVVEYYSDILEQWRRELFGIGDTEEAKLQEKSEEEQENIAQKGIEVLATIPEDYQSTYEMANNAYRTRANAIVSTAQDDIIYIDDASDDPLRGLRVFGKTDQVQTTGKNLLNIEENITLSNVYGIDVSLEADTYIVSLTSESHSGDQSPYLRFYTNNVWIQLKNGLAQSAVLTQPETKVYLYTYGMSASESAGVTARLNQLMVSKTGGDYEPYSGGVASPSPEWPQDLISKENPTIDVYGKNLLKEPTIGSTTTGNGITCTYEGNGVYHFTGTYSHVTESVGFVNVWMNMPVDPNAEYTISAKLLEGTPPCYFHPYIGLASATDAHRNWLVAHVAPTTTVGSVVTATGMPKHYLSDAKTLNKFWIYLYNDTREAYTVDFRIQVWVEQSSQSTEYRSYSKQSFSLNCTLPGIPVESDGNYTDPNGQQWICDEIDFERGVYVQRVKPVILNGTESWNYYSSGDGVNQFYSMFNDCYTNNNTINAIATGFKGTSVSNRSYNYSTVYTASQSSYNYICVNIQGYTTSGEFATFLSENPITVLYRLKNPIETELTAEELVVFGKLHSNYPNTTILNDAGATMEVKYNEDLKMYADEIMEDAANVVITQDKIQAAVDNWLSAHYSTAEGVSF